MWGTNPAHIVKTVSAGFLYETGIKGRSYKTETGTGGYVGMLSGCFTVPGLVNSTDEFRESNRYFVGVV